MSHITNTSPDIYKDGPRAWLEANRHWRASENIAHARYMLTLAQTAQAKAFWQLVLDRLGN